MSGHGFRPQAALAAVLAGGLLGLGLGGCGGSGVPVSKTRTTQTATATGHSAATGGSSRATGSVKAVLVGQDHHPVANQNWTYAIHVADVHGRPLPGMLETEFTFQGAVVGRDTPPTHRFSDGHFREKLKFPTTAIGYPVDLQVVVHTRRGSVTLDWPVMVRK